MYHLATIKKNSKYLSTLIVLRVYCVFWGMEKSINFIAQKVLCKKRNLQQKLCFAISKVNLFFGHLKKKYQLKVIVGAGATRYPGWISTDVNFFDVRVERDWAKLFTQNSLSNILAEHVLEHLSVADAKEFLTYAHRYLKNEGCLRIAVPDANHFSPYVRALTRPNGLEQGAEDHKTFWDIYALTSIAKDVGFKVYPLEFFDAKGNVHLNEWDDRNGFIARSSKHYCGRFTECESELKKFYEGMSEEHKQQSLDYNVTYMSLLVDLIKEDNTYSVYDYKYDACVISNSEAVDFFSKRCDVEIIYKNTFNYSTIAALNGNMAKYMLQFGFPIDSFFEITFLEKLGKKFDVIFDVGANHGVTTCYFSKISKKVFAFEPIPDCVQKMERNLSINSVSNVEIIQKAVSDNVSKIPFYVFESDGHSSIKKHSLSKFNYEMTVLSTTVDEFCRERDIKYVDLLSIDVEGLEFQVLEGSAGMLSRQAIGMVFFEVTKAYINDKEIQKIYNLLDRYGYGIYDLGLSAVPVSRLGWHQDLVAILPQVRKEYLLLV